MRFQLHKTSLWLSVLATTMLATQAFAQEPSQLEQAEEVSTQYRSLHYIELPVAIEPGLDPVLPVPPETPEPEDDPEFIRRMNNIREYSMTVEEIESAGGAWDQALVEELTALGNLQQLQGDHAAAIDSFDRAVHINRINSGLHTLDQIPAVERMIDSYIAVGDWEQADLYNNYLFFVQQKAFGSEDPRIIPVLDRLANWHIRAFNIGYGGQSMGLRLSSAQILYNAAARMVSFHFGRDDERFVDLLRNMASTAYLISSYPEYMSELNRPEFRITQDALRQKLNERTGGSPQGFRAGEQALLEIVAHYRELPDNTWELAEAIAHLADWYLLYERRRNAWNLYAEAWALLAQLENGEELNRRLFGQVIPIPTFMDQPKNLDPSSGTSRDGSSLLYDYADVALDVTVNGTVRNVRVLTEYPPEDAGQLTRLQREVRMSHFRPVINDGQAVRTNDIQFRYRYWY